MKNGHSKDMTHFALLVKLAEVKKKVSAEKERSGYFSHPLDVYKASPLYKFLGYQQALL